MTTVRRSPVPMNDLSRASTDHRGALLGAVAAVLDSGHYVHGGQHSAFEEEFAAYCALPHAVGVANGTEAITLSLLAVGASKGSEVVTVANAGGYATTAIKSIGAVPVYVDVEPSTLLMSATALAGVIGSRRPAAVVVTHLYGNAADMSAIMRVCGPLGIPVVEDCAQGAGLRIDGSHVGSFGDAGAFSFYPTKNLGALGDAGAVVTSSDAVADRIRALRQYGWASKYTVTEVGGRNSRLDELQAAVLRVRLGDLDRRNQRRRGVLARYAEALPSGVGRMVTTHGGVAHLAVGLFRDRDAVRTALLGSVGTDVHYPVADHRQPAWLADARAVALPATERACAEVLTLPCFPELTDDEVDTVCEAISALS